MAQIRLENVSKKFSSKDGEVLALKDINLEIEAGEIYGIIGMSGAGKSTLVRSLNYLDKPTQGKIWIEGEELGSLSKKELRLKRRNISMIFQHFNLLMQKNILENVMFPLKIQKEKRKVAIERARELLKIVGLEEKLNAYPSQLSGGQKQRVAIARALASNPHILLCDEATSALDPQTTKAILSLLKDINQKFGITIIIITHQMEVIREICEKVAIIEKGQLVEHGSVEDIFNHPKSRVGKQLILESQINPDAGGEIPEIRGESLLRIVFSENSAFEPVVGNLIIRLGQPVNILSADTRNVGGKAKGEMLLGVAEERKEEAVSFLKERGLSVWEVNEEDD